MSEANTSRKSATATKRDLYQEVTDKLIEAIEAGTAPWQRPWSEVASAGLAMNGVSSRHYNGVNALLLMMTAQVEGFTDNRWFTFKQANDLGAKVKKGSKSTPVYFFKMLDARGTEVEGKATGSDAGKPERQIPFLTEYRVFHASQIEGVEALAQPERPWSPIEAVQQLVDRMQPEIRYGGDRAFYAPGPGRDFIVLPHESAFPTKEAHAGTLAHELGHWTGAEHRLNRIFGTWGTEAYAAEELRAEIFSACLCAELGIATPLDNHAAYVGSWVKKLREDKFEIFRAAKDARRMVDFVTGRLVLDLNPEEATKPMTTPAFVPVQQPESEPAPVALSAVLARARQAVKQGERVRRHEHVPVAHTMEGQGLGVGASKGMGA